MKLFNHKKGQEMNYIIFLVIFVTLFGIINGIMHIQAKKETKAPNNIIEAITQQFDRLMNWVDGLVNKLPNIPIVTQFWDFIMSSYDFLYVHEYLGMVYLAFFGVPFGYVILKLLRGGG